MSTSPYSSRRERMRVVMLLGIVLVAPIGCHHRPSAVTGASSEDTLPARGSATTGAVQTITAEELANARVKRVEELLAGRVAGVRVIPTGNGGFAIRIRGPGTVRGNAEPLYVVDGMAVQLEPGEGLNWLNPADIERIDVLKDPASTSMYGVRGTNGVILIKTKRGSR